MSQEPVPDRPSAEPPIALFTFFTTVVVGALFAFVVLAVNEPAERGPARRFGGALIMALLYSPKYTVPSGIVAGPIAKWVACRRRGRQGLVGWLSAGVWWGGLAGAICFVAPDLLSYQTMRSPELVMLSLLYAVYGAIPGAVTGAIVAWYCRHAAAKR
jgi:hypothetical protein